MKILIIRNYPNYMDINKATYNIQELGLASALVKSGHECDIIFWTDGIEEDIKYYVPNTDKYITIYYRKSRTIFKNAIFKIDNIIEKYDVIQTCEYNQIQSIIYAKKYANKLVIYHGQYYGKENKKYNIWCKLIDFIAIPLYKKNNIKFITKSKLSKEFLVGKEINANNVFDLGVGINKDALKLNSQDNNDKIKKYIEDISNKKNILYVGEYMPRRHIEFIGNIVKKLNDNNDEYRLVTIGRTSSPYAQNVKKYFDENNITQYVYHIEKIEQKYLSEIYKNCSLFIFPSTYEIFGMVLIEAMYFGMPVLSSYNGGSSTMIKNEENGFIIDSLEEDIWINKIKELFHDESKLNTIKRNAQNTIENNFTWDKLVQNFINVYKQV